MQIFIPGDVPSSKNSKVKSKKGIFHSKTVRKYLSGLGIKHYSTRNKYIDTLKTKPDIFIDSVEPLKEELKKADPPYRIGFHFVRGSKRSFDFHNMVQLVADLLVAADVIEDDDMDHFIPLPYKRNGEYYSIDREDPGVYIKLYK